MTNVVAFPKGCALCAVSQEIYRAQESRRAVIHMALVRGFSLGSVLAELGSGEDSALVDFIANGSCVTHRDLIEAMRAEIRANVDRVRDAAADTLPAPEGGV